MDPVPVRGSSAAAGASVTHCTLHSNPKLLVTAPDSKVDQGSDMGMRLLVQPHKQLRHAW